MDQNRSKAGSAAVGVVGSAVGVSGFGLDDAGAVGDDLFEFGHGEVGVRERDVGGQEHAVVGVVTDFFVHPSVEGADVGVEGRDVVGEFVLDVVGRGGEHDGFVHALFVHEGESQVAVAECFGFVAEVFNECSAFFFAQSFERVEAIEEHAGDDAELRSVTALRDGASSGADVGGVAEELFEFFFGERDVTGLELGGLPGEDLDGLAVGTDDRSDGEVGVFRVDVTLEAVGGFVEVVVGIIDAVAEVR
jgi:hypothetical protein